MVVRERCSYGRLQKADPDRPYGLGEAAFWLQTLLRRALMRLGTRALLAAILKRESRAAILAE
jgi:hypothetical protein